MSSLCALRITGNRESAAASRTLTGSGLYSASALAKDCSPPNENRVTPLTR